MPGEIIIAKTLEEGLDQLIEIYNSQSTSFKKINKEEYDKYKESEHEDSDNHLNLEKLGKESDVVDLAYYKYLPDHKTAYHVHLIHVDGKSTLDDYFIIKRRKE